MHEWGLRNVIEGDLNYWKIWISPDKATARGVIRDNPGKFQLVRPLIAEKMSRESLALELSPRVTSSSAGLLSSGRVRGRR